MRKNVFYLTHSSSISRLHTFEQSKVEALVMLDISYLPLRPGTPTEVDYWPSELSNRTKTKVVPRLRGALLRSSAMSSEQCGGKSRVYPDKEAAVERLLQPPGYMRGRPLKIILNILDLRYPSAESYNQVVRSRRSLFVKVLSSLWREELVRLKMQPGLSSAETGGWSLFPEFRS